MLNRAFALSALILIATSAAMADNSLLYLELQGVAGYSFDSKETVYYSRSPDEPMQKPSAGFDYLRRLSTESGDWGTVALQGRIAYDENQGNKYEFQLYNAYIRKKYDNYDLFVGHIRQAFGLASYFDTHGLLIQTLVMEGFGYDRDWGAGYYRQLESGDVAVTCTTGSGMPLRVNDSYLLSGRYSLGVLEKDNYACGLSLSLGRIIETMGNKILSPESITSKTVSLDGAWAVNNFEAKFEMDRGERGGIDVFGSLLRLSCGLLEENRLKLEFQPVLVDPGTGTAGYNAYSGVSYAINGSLTLRTMYSANEKMVAGQIYFYYKV